MSSVQVFAVEDSSVQVCWRGLPPGPVRVTAAGREVTVESDGRPGAATVDGLPADCQIEVGVEPGGHRRPIRTLAPPPGPERFRVATINDLHVGAHSFGLFGLINEPDDVAAPHPVRCARAAISEALAWGAGLLVVKGDLTERSTPENWEVVGDLLGSLPVPVAVVPGNHDVRPDREIDPQPGLARHGLHLTHGAEALEVPGLRVVLVDSTRMNHNAGQIGPVQDKVLELLGASPGPALVATHHHPQRWRLPTSWPPGIPGPEAGAFLAAVAASNPTTMVTTGHSHRHRRYQRAGLTISEVGSTKDYPGTWAGYAVHEGGIRQVVRRVAAPDAIAWTERCRRAVGGVWGRWAPGALDDRCFVVRW